MSVVDLTSDAPGPALSKPAAASAPVHERLTTADGQPLRTALARAQARSRRRALYLVLPLLVFVVVTFLMPIGQLLMQSVHNDAFTHWQDRDTGEEIQLMVELREWFDATEPGTPPTRSPLRP